MLTAMLRRRRSVMGVGLVTSITLALSVVAFLYQGFTTANVDLNDGGVWVTKPSGLLVGHLNQQAQVLDSGLRTTTNDFDILQSGNTVLTHDRANATLTVVDPAKVVLGTPVTLPATASVALGGDTIAILDQATGDLFVTTVEAVASFSIAGADPAVTLGAGAAVAVGADGTVRAVSASDKALVTLVADGQGGFGEPARTGLTGLPDKSTLSIAAVGTDSVVYDSIGSTLYLPGGKTATVDNASGALLQQSGPQANSVLVATASKLVIQPLDGGSATAVDAGADGVPAAPVSLGGCSYAAWSGSARYLRDCPGSSDDVARTIDHLKADSALTFRVNRKVVVLNDLNSGLVWLVDQDMVTVDNWSDVTPPPAESDSEPNNTVTQIVENVLPKRTDTNTPPVAVDDALGVRPGRSVILPVLDNDSDADGDLLTATVAGDGPKIGAVQPIFGGTALQIAVAGDAAGSASFRYTVSDGRGGTAEGTVTLTVSAAGTNKPPVQKRASGFVVEQGASVTQNMLTDWSDPDGDDLFLQAAASADDDVVSSKADGMLTYGAVGQNLGRKDVTLVVSDGTDTATGTARADVRAAGSTKPSTNPDHVTTVAGQPVTVSPLVNDLSPSGAVLRLAKLDEVPGATLVPDFTAGTFTFTATVAKTYYVQYLATDGPNTALGLVRVDVTDASATDLPPVAVRDVALLPTGRDVLVDVLQNDTDPAGGILVVQSVTIPANLGITVAVLEHRVLHITDQSGLNGPITIGYTVSNGTQTAQGDVLVIPVPSPAKLRPPVAVDDAATVRAGDIVTIPVLANDSHPDGDTLTLSPTLVAPLVDPADGTLFVDGNTLRFKAGTTAKTVYATYDVVDSQGQKDAGYVTIQILAAAPESNSPPHPQALTARVLAGSTVRIPVPLDQIDPDGDSVELVGQGIAPGKGRITEVGAGWLTYEAYERSTGTDTFSYVVRDRVGAAATASIRVGIAQPGAVNQKPFAIKDAVSARPDRQVAVAVLVNDTDPDGDTLTLLKDGLTVPAGIEAKIAGDRVLVQTPSAQGESSISYTATDPWGATAIGTLQVSVSKDAPLKAPIARDDRVASADIVGKTAVDVPVLRNDEDPDGSAANLTVTVADPAATVATGGVVRVTLAAAAQIILYTTTDADGLTASAFILVPGLEQQRPTLTTPVKTVEVKSGAPVTLNLADYVTVAAGKTPRITVATSVTAAHASGAALIKDESTLQYTSAADYAGPDAISFEVTDGTGPDDPKGLTAVLSIPITVLAPDNRAPSFVGGTVELAPGDAAVTVSLKAMSKDPDPGDLEKLSYTLGTVPAGFSLSVSGQSLTASVDKSVPKGTTGSVQLTISDGVSAPATGTLNLSVIASTKPLATTTDDVVPEAHQGQASTVSVLGNDTSPFPDQPLTLVSVAVETGDGTATVSGSDVVVTPGGSFVGTMVVRYRVADATKDTEREVDGRIRLTVQGKPDAPGTPVASGEQDSTLVLSWTPPSNNGAEITSYTVRSPQGFSQSCASTTCTLTGLTNGTAYSFNVTATNAVGESAASATSNALTPDVRPETPSITSAVRGDQAMTVTWSAPVNNGSPVTHYTLRITGPDGLHDLDVVGTTTKVLTGLTNGGSYQASVQALSSRELASDFSAESAPVIPAGVPVAPTQPTTARLAAVGSQAQLDVSWGAEPYNNGADITGYKITVQPGGAIVTAPNGSTHAAVVINTSTTDYTFTVVATNGVGDSLPSAASTPRRAVLAPGAPSNVVASEGDNSVGVTFGAAAGNGATTGELAYQYSVSGGAWRSDWASGGSGTSGTIANGQVNNNGSYTIAIRAVSNFDGVSYEGAGSAASNAVAPFGQPNQPGAGASGGGAQVSLQWGPPGPNGRAITALEISIDGGGWESVGVGSGNRNVGSYSESHSISVRATDAAGQQSTNSASASSGAAPVAKTWVTRSGQVLTYHWQNLPAGSWTAVSKFRCYNVAPNTQQGTANVVLTLPGSFSAGNGSIDMDCGTGANDSYSIEPWQYGPWLQVGGSWGG
ncbi:Ig-like domain-containing protein [Cryobacterium zhongshanensis]|uniref:Ig-like domain-containing protein n=1 Tax=Cryobacterium zhongshanensis TaxID=2928153 RepID=A0AA41QVP6_9MICO|nr:Ig-like domain-containing protein [Cryobacterium zhongshanensis]MCI4658185.1 Ig-like domain-containing protein [Cryobacterium zhongshanensis]